MSGDAKDDDTPSKTPDVCASTDARKIVLARRARFVAAAIAGVGIACSDPKHPEPCLAPMPPDPGDHRPGPNVCLSVSPAPCLEIPPADAGAPDAPTEPEPMPCLKVAPPKDPPKAPKPK